MFLKHFTQSTGKQLCWSLFLISQYPASYFFNKRLRRFLVDIAKLSRTPFLQEHLETRYSAFMEHLMLMLMLV